MSATGLDSAGSERSHRRWLARAMEHRLARSLQGEGLKAKALRGAGWTLVGFGANKVLGLVSTLVLTRLLFPEVFGLMALAGVFLTGLQMFSDIGIRPSIIQNKRGDDPDFLNTAWTIQIIRGFVLWLIACAIAYPVSVVYEEPSLFPILCVLGSTAAIRGFQSTGYATANRKLTLGKLTCVEFSTHLIGLVTTIAWAWNHPTVWALVGGAVISAMFSVALGYRVLSTHPHRLRWESDGVRQLIRFGKWIFVSTSLMFIAQHGDKLVLPKVMSVTDLSFYALAMGILLIPMSIFKKVVSQVLFPVYSNILNQGGIDRVNRVTNRFVLLAAPMYLIPLSMLFLGDLVIGVMYDSRYSQAGGALSILAIGTYMAMMRSSQNGLLLAAGNSKRATVSLSSRVFTGLPLATVLASFWGLEGFCAGMVIADGVSLLVQRHMTRKTIPGLRRGLDYVLISLLLIAVILRCLIR